MTPTFQPKRQKATPTSAKHIMLNNPCRTCPATSVKQIAFVEKYESCDRPNYQRATDEQHHGNSMWSCQRFEMVLDLVSLNYSAGLV